MPEHARVYGVEQTVCEPAGFEEFRIVESDSTPGGVPMMLPDRAPCQMFIRDRITALRLGTAPASLPDFEY